MSSNITSSLAKCQGSHRLKKIGLNSPRFSPSSRPTPTLTILSILYPSGVVDIHNPRNFDPVIAINHRLDEPKPLENLASRRNKAGSISKTTVCPA